MSVQMSVQQMSCPNCGAPIALAGGSNRLTCAYCGSTLNIQHGEGDAARKTAEKSGQTIQGPSAPTQEGIRPGLSAPPSAPAKKPWYRSLGCLIAAFLFFTPLWSILILTDKEQTRVVKVIAAVLLVLLVVYCIAAPMNGGK